MAHTLHHQKMHQGTGKNYPVEENVLRADFEDKNSRQQSQNRQAANQKPSGFVRRLFSFVAAIHYSLANSASIAVLNWA